MNGPDPTVKSELSGTFKKSLDPSKKKLPPYKLLWTREATAPLTVTAFVVLPLLIRLLTSLALPTNGRARVSPESISWVPSIFIADIPAAWPAEPWRIFIFDNEPRNKEIIDRMYKLIDKEYMIVIWPEGQKEKDINEMVINGKTKEQVQKIISDNTYSGLSAITQLNAYKRI